MGGGVACLTKGEAGPEVERAVGFGDGGESPDRHLAIGF